MGQVASLAICKTEGKFVWAEGKAPISNEMLLAIVREEGSFTAGPCSCYDLRGDCEVDTPGSGSVCYLISMVYLVSAPGLEPGTL
jgi:hypothetical protein